MPPIICEFCGMGFNTSGEFWDHKYAKKHLEGYKQGPGDYQGWEPKNARPPFRRRV